MRKWIGIAIIILVLIILVVLALTTAQWLEPSLAFLGTNADTIQTLADLTQLVLWVGAGAALVAGFVLGWRRRPKAGTPNAAATPTYDAKVEGGGAVAQDRSAAAGKQAGFGR